MTLTRLLALGDALTKFFDFADGVVFGLIAELDRWRPTRDAIEYVHVAHLPPVPTPAMWAAKAALPS